MVGLGRVFIWAWLLVSACAEDKDGASLRPSSSSAASLKPLADTEQNAVAVTRTDYGEDWARNEAADGNDPGGDDDGSETPLNPRAPGAARSGWGDPSAAAPGGLPGAPAGGEGENPVVAPGGNPQPGRRITRTGPLQPVLRNNQEPTRVDEPTDDGPIKTVHLPIDPNTQAIFDQYCTTCHLFTGDPEGQRSRFLQSYMRLRNGNMPPHGALQPTQQERQAMIDWLGGMREDGAFSPAFEPAGDVAVAIERNCAGGCHRNFSTYENALRSSRVIFVKVRNRSMPIRIGWKSEADRQLVYDWANAKATPPFQPAFISKSIEHHCRDCHASDWTRDPREILRRYDDFAAVVTSADGRTDFHPYSVADSGLSKLPRIAAWLEEAATAAAANSDGGAADSDGTGDTGGDGTPGDDTGSDDNSGTAGDNTGAGSAGDNTGSGTAGENTGAGSAGDNTGSGTAGDNTGSGTAGDNTGAGSAGDSTGAGTAP